MATTIQLSSETRNKLARLKSTSRETYDEVLNKLLALVPEGDEEGLYTQSFRVGLLTARVDFKEGRVVDHEHVKKRLGL
jgi:predicted transcriptional regulator